MSQDKRQSSTQNQLKAILNGIFYDLVSKSFFSPLEVVKMRLQSQNEMIKQGYLQQRYRGIIDCSKRIVSEEGLKALWKGNFTHILISLMNNSLSFPINSLIRQIINAKREDGYQVWIASNLASGGLAGFFSSIFSYPLDYARTRLTNDFHSPKIGNQKQYNGLIDVFRKTLASDGIVGFYRGFIISSFGIIIYRAVYFGLYGSFRHLIPYNNIFLHFGYSWTVTIAASMASYTVDTVKRRMMMTSGQAVKYRGSIDCIRYVLKNEGFKHLFNGFSLTLIKSITSACLLSIYDQYSRSNNQHHHNKGKNSSN
ncbi:hypothetical protein ABPG72_008783 [Tetrahymena utriculariae]